MRPVSVQIIAEADSSRDALEATLRQHGCDVLVSDDAALGIERAVIHLPNVVLISPHLPAGGSLAAFEQIPQRVDASHEPVIVMIPVGRRIQTCDEPGEPTRPFDVGRFAHAVTQLGNSTSASVSVCDQLTLQGLQLDRKAFRAAIDGRELRLTVTEFNVLWLLASNTGAVLTRRELCDECREDPSDPPCRSIDVHVRSLRLKLGERSDLVETVRGVGYRMRDTQLDLTACDPATACC